MATRSASKIRESLKKAQNVGCIEESVDIAGCSIVLRNLRPEEYPAILQDLEDVPEEEYVFAYQLENVSRSIVEVNGEDLRDVAFIEDEVPSGVFQLICQLPSEAAASAISKKLREEFKVKSTIVPPQEEGDTSTRLVKTERHEWLRKNVLATWSKEALVVSWRKFSELLAKADEKAKEGVKFHIPDETDEQKVRRLLEEMAEASEDLPNELLDRILGEAGLLRKANKEELDVAAERLAAVRDTSPASSAPAPVAAPADPPVQSAPPDAEALMRNRQPLNQQYTSPPQPAQPSPTPAQTRAQVPDNIRQAAVLNTASVNPSMVDATSGRPEAPPLARWAGHDEDAPAQGSRSSKIAALESLDGLEDVGPPVASPFARPRPLTPEEIPVHSEKSAPVDPKGLMSIVEKPPVVGINPRFKRPNQV